jgi:hypothetical protein
MAEDPKKLAQEIKQGGYDVGVINPNSQGGASPPTHNGPNDGIKEGDDLSKKTRITLGRYLGATTRTNYIPIAENQTNENNESRLTTVTGKPAPLDQNPNGGVRYAEPKDIKATSEAYDTPDAGPSDNTTSLSVALRKGKRDGGEFDGNNLLRTGVPAVRDRYTSAVLKSNRFNVSTKYRDDLRNPDDIPRDLAYYSRTRVPDTERVDGKPGTKSISPQQMANVSKVLMLRATGEIDSNSRDFNPDGNIGALLPGASQILPAQIINSRDLEARDVLESMINEEIGSHAPGPDTSSWGALNNQLEPFTGILPAGMVALCVALILATQLAFEILSLVMGLVPDKARFAVDGKGIGKKGQFRFVGGESKGLFGSGLSLGGATDIQSLLGLRDTQYPYNDCFKEGMDIFFGKPPEGGGLIGNVVNAAGNSFKKALESPGFYIIFCRSIIRSGYGIGKKLSELGSNPLTISQGIFNIIEDLRSSKIIAAFNMFAGLGDASFRQTYTNDQALNQDAIPNEASAVYKSRLKDSRALAWRQASAASLYILPASLSYQTNIARATGNKVVEHWDPLSTDIESVPGRSTNVYYAKPGKHRIPADVVQKFEKALDAEYVPFYFHDMRTNEIIQFRAFLTTLTEDYTPNWESVEAYGRVDPIRIYKNTARRINLSFRVVSLDAQDFDNMWFKINKLVTLVYPQWSRGKRVTTADGKLEFSQPFSQLISSSPLVRLRVGDLVRSNYSKFAVSRIFDLGSEGELQQAIQQSLSEDLSRLQQYINQFTLTQGDFSGEIVDEIQKAMDSRTIQMSIRGNTLVVVDPPGPEAESPGAAIAGALAALTGKDKKKSRPVPLNKSVKVKRIISASEAGLVLELDDKELAAAKTNRIAVAYGPHLLVEFAPGIEKLRRSTASPDGAGDFLNPETNPIIKYFENNIGKGLAGTIDSLNFAWLEENTWNVHDPGSQAPKSCTITLSFTVIHDIAPGIDYAGFNRAPIYRVGKQVEAITHMGENDDVKSNPTQPKPAGKGDPLSSIPKLPGL